jgi:hypothetical protein
LLRCLRQHRWRRRPTARDNRWRQDLGYLATELPQRHVNLFFQMPRTTFEAAVQDLDRAIPSLTDAQVMVGLARIVALAGDGHTNLWLTIWIEK